MLACADTAAHAVAAGLRAAFTLATHPLLLSVLVPKLKIVRINSTQTGVAHQLGLNWRCASAGPEPE
jgi:hypothetical protein